MRVSIRHPLLNGRFKAETLKRYLVVSGDLHDHWEAIVIGGRVAKGVHDGPHLLDPVQAGDWRAHHLPGRRQSSRGAEWEIKHRVTTVTPTTFPLEAFAQSDEGSPGRQPMGGCRGLPVQEGDALQLDVDIIQALRAGNDRQHYGAALTCLPFLTSRSSIDRHEGQQSDCRMMFVIDFFGSFFFGRLWPTECVSHSLS